MRWADAAACRERPFALGCFGCTECLTCGMLLMLALSVVTSSNHSLDILSISLHVETLACQGPLVSSACVCICRCCQCLVWTPPAP
jgi:hypothetical protein